MITILNKIDQVEDMEEIKRQYPEFSNAVIISAKKSIGIDQLVLRIKQELFETFIPISVTVPYKNGNLISLFHEFGKIDHIENNVGSVKISGSIPGRLMAEFEKFKQQQKSRDTE